MIFIKRHNKRSKRQEQEILQQGLQLPVAEPNPVPHQQPQQRPNKLDTGSVADAHKFLHPANTAGQARSRPIAALQPLQVPIAPPGFIMVPQPAMVAGAQPEQQATGRGRTRRLLWGNLSKNTDQGRALQNAPNAKKLEGPTTSSISATACFCPETSFESYEEWKRSMESKKYKQKKNLKNM